MNFFNNFIVTERPRLLQELIPFNKNTHMFIFSKINSERIENPLSHYELMLYDLSINLKLSVKWIYWGYYFFIFISETLTNTRSFKISKLADNAIQDIIEDAAQPHIFTINNQIIDSEEKLNNLLTQYALDKNITKNTKIHLKLKLNLHEFIILSEIVTPAVIKFNIINI